MKRTFLKIAVCALLAVPALSRAQNNAMPPAATAPLLPPLVTAPEAQPPAETNAPAKPRRTRTTLSLTGKASNVDTNAMTLTVGKHTFDISSETRITKAGKPAILSDIAVDDKVGVTYKKSGEKFDALTITDAKKSEKPAGETKDAATPK
jgi:hypothetical protein